MPIHLINFHYISLDGECRPYKVKSRSQDEFERQVEYVAKNFLKLNVHDPEQYSYYSNSAEHAFILTFDDGYREHLNAARILRSHDLNGIFFPCKSSTSGHPLIPNLIHALLATDYPPKKILGRIESILLQHKLTLTLNGAEYISLADYSKMLVDNSRFTKCPSTILIKRILQRDLASISERMQVINQLTSELNITDLDWKDIYMNAEMLREIKDLGMLIGSHGLTHEHLSSLSNQCQSQEIRESLNWLKGQNLLNTTASPVTMCYPYGSYNKTTIELLEQNDIQFGFTVKQGPCTSVKGDNRFMIPRWDTNDWWQDDLPLAPF